MSATILEVGDAIVTEFNGTAWSAKPAGTPSLARAYYAKVEDYPAGTVFLTLIALRSASTRVARTPIRQREFGYWLDLQVMLGTNTRKDVPTVDAWVNFVEQVREYFADGHRLASPWGAYWYESAVHANQDEVWNPEQLYLSGVFEAALDLTVRGDDA